MIKESNCCSFLAKLCGRICKGKQAESVKPDIKAQIDEILNAPIEKVESENNHSITLQMPKTTIVTGNGNNPIVNPAVGYVNSCDSRSGRNNRRDSKLSSESPGLFYDQALTTENLNKESVIHNLDEAYKILQGIGDESSISYPEEPPSPEKFSRVVKNLNFKEIMSEEN